MKLRPYQTRAVEAIHREWREHRVTLGVAATGAGKTVMAVHALRQVQQRTGKRVMCLAHREELIEQAASKVEEISESKAGIEMGERQADLPLIGDASPFVVGSIQTQVAGKNGGRMTRFNPRDFGAIWIDEAHRVRSPSYRKVIDYYTRGNPDLRVLLVTATPNRTDNKSLNPVVDSVAFDYGLRYSLDESWLVPIRQTEVMVDGLDLDHVRTTRAGDFADDEIAREVEAEAALHDMTAATIETCCGMQQGDIKRILSECTRQDGSVDHDRARQLTRNAARDRRPAIVFNASVWHAQRYAEILNRWLGEGTASAVYHGMSEDRKGIVSGYQSGKIQFLTNFGVATEGFDAPATARVIIARPTKSRLLYEQMVGRGTRTLPGVVDGEYQGVNLWSSPEIRAASIAASAKPYCEVIDFTGQSQQLQTTRVVDILAGSERDDEVVAKAKSMMDDDPTKPANQAIREAEAFLDAKRREDEERRRREAEAKRRRMIFDVGYQKRDANQPGWNWQASAQNQSGASSEKPITANQARFLRKRGKDPDRMTPTEARREIGNIKSKWTGMVTNRQAQLLRRHGVQVDENTMTKKEASEKIDQIAQKQGWGKQAQSPLSQTPPKAPTNMRF